jgi:hypothetical protein
LPQVTLAATPGRTADKVTILCIRHPRLAERPARLLANAAQHDLQGGRDIFRRRHFHRDGLEETELLFAG